MQKVKNGSPYYQMVISIKNLTSDFLGNRKFEINNLQ